MPKVDLCCGRPLYDYGMLDTAKRWLEQILRGLRDEIEAGTPMVGLEPSCTAVFRDEVVEMFPQNEDARRLKKQTFTWRSSSRNMRRLPVPQLQRKALVHGHCHHKAVMKIDCEKKVLKRMGLDY